MAVDLILGVLQAADVAKTQRAQQRLAELGNQKSALFDRVMAAVGPKTKKPMPTGEDLIAQVMAAAEPSKRQMAEAKLMGLGQGSVAVAEDQPKVEAMKKLEGALLTAVVDQIMPKDSDTLYGEGTSGEVARQFQVDGLADAVAEAEPLGLAKQFYGQEPGSQLESLSRDQQWPYFTRRAITPYAA